MHIGIADIESKNFLPKNFLLAVKNAAEIPMTNASKVEKKACFRVKIVVFHKPSILECALFPIRLDSEWNVGINADTRALKKIMQSTANIVRAKIEMLFFTRNLFFILFC